MTAWTRDDWIAERDYIVSIDPGNPGPCYNNDPHCFRTYCAMQARSAAHDGYRDIGLQIARHRFASQPGSREDWVREEAALLAVDPSRPGPAFDNDPKVYRDLVTSRALWADAAGHDDIAAAIRLHQQSSGRTAA